MREKIKQTLFDHIKKTDGNLDVDEISKFIIKNYPKSNWQQKDLDYYRRHIVFDWGRFYNEFDKNVRENILKDFQPRERRNYSRGHRKYDENVTQKLNRNRISEFDFDEKLKLDANSMSQHYEIVYCLERTMRNIVSEVMALKYGSDWWNNRVNLEIKKKVTSNKKLESNTGHTKLSGNEIDYTTFGDLRQIIDANWDDFLHKFDSRHAFNRIMYTLNQLRGPIAHSNYLSEDEVTRLDLTVKDWFRLINI